MEGNMKEEQDKKIVTYIFDSNDDNTAVYTLAKTKTWHIISSLCASLMSVPFGLMLGWPSPVYPVLLKSESPIPITLDQSAMIAGFLMIGNILGTPFSTKTFFKSKHGIILSTGLMACGWFIMWQAKNIYWLLGSRFLIGLANGYGLGQLKRYIKEICECNISVLLMKQITLHTFFGVLAIFSFGPFVNFRDISVISLIINVCILFITILLPSASRKKLEANKINLVNVPFNAQIDISNKINEVPKNMKTISTEYSFKRIIQNKKLRCHFNIFWFLIFCQQFSGAPATIIYTQILFEKFHSFNSVYFSILYVAIFIIANVLSIFVLSKYNKRSIILFSSVAVSLVILIKICVIYFKFNETYWNYSSAIVMSFYIFFHTIGLGNIPFTMISDFFPGDCRNFITIFFVMFHCALAIIITKLFQVLMSWYNLYVPFYLFLTVSVISFFFVLIYFPRYKNLQN